MPFTPSHAVVALPFLRTPLVPGAIAVGAMTPDLPLFVRAVVPRYDTTHDPVWLPVTVLFALALLLLWRCVLRPAAGALSPRWVAERLPATWDGGAPAAFRETFATRARPGRASVAGVVLVLASLAIGVATHLIWDAFTHDGRWGEELIPALGEYWGPLLGIKWLQHGSSFAGLAILGVWGIRWLTARDPRAVTAIVPVVVRWSWWASLPVLLLAAWCAGLFAYGPLTADFTVAHLAYRVLPPACAVWAALTVALAVGVQIRARSGR